MENIVVTQEFKKFVFDLIQKIRNSQYVSLIDLFILGYGKGNLHKKKEYGQGKAIVEEVSVEL